MACLRTPNGEAIFSCAACLAMFMLFVWHTCSSLVAVGISTLIFGMYVGIYPDRFRDRRGSLKTAYALLGFMGLLAALVAVTSFVPSH